MIKFQMYLWESGTGNATITTPGSSLPQNQPISWSFDEMEKQVTVDYNTMEDPYVYDVEIITPNELKWFLDRNGVLTTITLSRK